MKLTPPFNRETFFWALFFLLGAAALLPRGRLRIFLQPKRPDGRTRPAGIENYQDYTAAQLTL